METAIRYEVRPESRTVHVRVNAHLVNNDPQTRRQQDRPSSYYYVLDFPVPQGATNIRAVDAAGSQLRVTPKGTESSFWSIASVFFAQPLYYGGTYDFTLEYDLTTDRDSDILVTSGYITFPALPAGDTSTVQIAVPGSPYQASVDHPDCQQQSATEYRCPVADPESFVAWVEVFRPDQRESTSGQVEVGGRQVTVEVSYFTGEEAWAGQVLELFRRGLPLLEQLNGHPYSRADTIRVVEARRFDTGGYAGTATDSCGNACTIQLLPTSGNVTALHEIAHLWSHIYRKRWISEGVAQALAERAAVILGLPLDDRLPELSQVSPMDLPLDRWEAPATVPLPTPRDQQAEMYGYIKSAAFMKLLLETVGLDALKAANATLAAEGQPADSRHFMDVLEETSGQVLDSLFTTWVFPPSEAELVQARRAARDRYARLLEAAAGQGLGEPEAVQRLLRAWDFPAANARMDQAEQALSQHATNLEAMAAHGLTEGDRFRTLWETEEPATALEFARGQDAAVQAMARAEERVQGPRDVWERIGLVGSDPKAKLERARSAFAADDPALAEQLAREAEREWANAGAAGRRRVIAGAVVLTLLTAVVVGSVIWYRRSPQAARL
ncbi:MAG TPA: hypothetical protein VIO14_03935 [Dehalococcoidia bacterium]